MKKEPQERKSIKLNIDERPAEQEQQSWTLEEIMDEFGGWTKRDAQEPEKSERPQVKRQAPQIPPPAARAPENPAPSDKTDEQKLLQSFAAGDTIRFTPVTDEQIRQAQEPKIWTYKGEPDPEPDALTKQERKRLEKDRKAAEQADRRLERFERKQARRTARRVRRQEQPEHVFDSLQQAYTWYAKPSTMPLRLIVSAVLALVSAVLLFFTTHSVGKLDPQRHIKLFSELMLGIMLAQTVLSFDVLLPNIRHAAKIRFDDKALLALQILVTSADAVFAILSGRVPFCTAVSLELAVALWGRLLLHSARRRSLKSASGMNAPVAAVREEKAWHGLDCIFRSKADAAAFALQIELPDAGGRVMRIYAPILTAATLALASISTVRSEENFLRVWTAFLIAGFPTGVLIAYGKPFAAIAKRLGRTGCAVAGWDGARTLGGEVGVCVEDADLFPAQNVTLNGMKIYSDRPVSQIIGFSMAVVQTAGSGLVPLFEELMHAQNGRHYTVDNFRRYEGGGLGAEIQGDVVLMGSLGFMRLMKVQMPEGAKLKQAIYLSVNRELAAVFALNYAPAANVSSSLNAMIRSGGLIPILATRDFMITPQFLKQRYRLPPDRVEFPTVEERAMLSSPDAIRQPKQGAMMVRDSFTCFASAVTGARAIRSAGRGSIAVAMAGAAIGILVLFFLSFIGAERAITCWNLELYHLLWLLPSILMTGLLGLGTEQKK